MNCLRIKYGESKQDISSVLRDLLPMDMIKIMSSQEWKKEIAKSYNQDSGMSPDEAKIAFLKVSFTTFISLIKVLIKSRQNF